MKQALKDALTIKSDTRDPTESSSTSSGGSSGSGGDPNTNNGARGGSLGGSSLSPGSSAGSDTTSADPGAPPTDEDFEVADISTPTRAPTSGGGPGSGGPTGSGIPGSPPVAKFSLTNKSTGLKALLSTIATIPEPVVPDPTITISKTPFDRYTEKFGLSALRPEIISFLDFENFYQQSGQLSGIGQIHYIQRRVSEETVAAASEVVEKYLIDNPVTKMKLEEIASKNLKIATDIAREMSNFQDAKEDLYNATFEFAIADAVSGEIISAVSNTSASTGTFVGATSFTVSTSTPSTPSVLTITINQPPTVKYEATTKFDDSTSGILGDLNSKFNNNTSIKNISKTALTLSLLRGAVAQLDGSKTDYFNYTNTENQLASTNVQNLIATTDSSPTSSLILFSGFENSQWKTIISNNDGDNSGIINLVNNITSLDSLFEITETVIYEIANVVIDKNSGKDISELSSEYTGVSPDSTSTPTLSSYLTSTAKINPVISFEDKPLLLQDINGSSEKYDSLLSLLVNNSSTENLNSIIDKFSSVESNINDYQNKLAYALKDDIGTHFYSTLFNSISSYIKASFLGDISSDISTTSNESAFRYFLLTASSDELLLKILAIIMIRNPVYTTSTFTGTMTKDVDFESSDMILSLTMSEVKSLSKSDKGVSIIYKNAIPFDNSSAEFGDIDALVSTSTNGFDYFYNFAKDLFNNLGIDLSNVKEDLFKRVMIISIFHYRNILQSFLNSALLEIIQENERVPADTKKGYTDTFVGYNITTKLVISKNKKNILLTTLDNFTSLTSDKDADFNLLESTLDGATTYTDLGLRTPDDDILKEISSDFHTLVLQDYAKHTKYRKESRQIFEHVLTRVTKQKNALNSMLKAVQDIETATGNTEKAEEIISKYYTVESTFQLLDKIKRMTEVIDATRISKELRTSNSYESLVTTASKYKVSHKNRIMLVAVGIPYGLFEMLRISNELVDESKYKLNLYLRRSGDVSNEPSKTVTIRPSSRIFIDYTSGTVFTDEASIDSAKTIAFSRDTGEIEEVTISAGNVKNSLLENSLGESYFEDVLGIYPRNAFKKQTYIGDLPEVVYATAAVDNLKFKQSESALLKSRYRASIMHHTLFNTSQLIRDIDSSSIFDGIAYVFVDLDKLGIAQNEILQMTANLDIVAE